MSSIRVSSFHKLLAEKGVSNVSAQPPPTSGWATTSSSNTQSYASASSSFTRPSHSTPQSQQTTQVSSIGQPPARSLTRGDILRMREQEKPVFTTTTGTLTATREFQSSDRGDRGGYGNDRGDYRGGNDRGDYRRDNRDGTDRGGYGNDRGTDRRDNRDGSGRREGTGAGTWSFDTLKNMKSNTSSRYAEPVPVEPKKPVLSSESEFPDLGIPTDTEDTKSSPVATKTVSFASKMASIWGTKKEVIETIKTSSMSEINDQQKDSRRKEKQQKYAESMEWDYQMAMIKKKRDWLIRIKRQYSKDCNYRHIDDIIREEGLEFNVNTEIDPELWLHEQMLYETTHRQLRINNTQPPIDYNWYIRETNLCVMAEWAHSDEPYEVIEERVVRGRYVPSID